MTGDIDRWLKEDGERFLRELGIKKGQTVLDFGCGSGHYTIPAARIVGNEGKVYAVDKDREALDELIRIAKSEGLRNIEPIRTSGEPKISLAAESVDVVLLYDVLHEYYFPEVNDRRKLLKEVFRILRTDGLISVFPKHMEIEDVVTEIEKANFYCARKTFKHLVHDDGYDKGYILNFRKTKKASS